MVFLLLVSVLVGGIGGRGGIKTASAKNNQLISSQGPHFSPRISDVVTASEYSEKTHTTKLMMMKMIIIIIIIMNKSQETTVFHRRQKLTSAMKQKPEK